MPVIQGDYVELSEGATVSTDASLGDYFHLAGVLASRTISNPTNPATGEQITYAIENLGGATETSWDSAFKLAGPWTEPSRDRARTISFFYNGSSWIENSRSGADVKLIAEDPTDIASLVGWWEAEDLVLADGDPVTTWPSREGADLVSPSGGEPTFKTAIQNGRPIVRFDGTDDYLSVVNPLTSRQSCSVFAVFAKGDTAAGLRALADFAGTSGAGLIVFEGAVLANRTEWHYGTGATVDQNTALTVGTAFHQWSWVVPNGAQPQLYKDAGAGIGPDASGNAGFAAITQTLLYVGSNGGTFRYMLGDLAELIVYRTALSDADRAAVATYLKNKWGTP